MGFDRLEEDDKGSDHDSEIFEEDDEMIHTVNRLLMPKAHKGEYGELIKAQQAIKISSVSLNEAVEEKETIYKRERDTIDLDFSFDVDDIQVEGVDNVNEYVDGFDETQLNIDENVIDL